MEFNSKFFLKNICFIYREERKTRLGETDLTDGKDPSCVVRGPKVPDDFPGGGDRLRSHTHKNFGCERRPLAKHP